MRGAQAFLFVHVVNPERVFLGAAEVEAALWLIGAALSVSGGTLSRCRPASTPSRAGPGDAGPMSGATPGRAGALGSGSDTGGKLDRRGAGPSESSASRVKRQDRNQAPSAEVLMGPEGASASRRTRGPTPPRTFGFSALVVPCPKAALLGSSGWVGQGPSRSEGPKGPEGTEGRRLEGWCTDRSGGPGLTSP